VELEYQQRELRETPKKQELVKLEKAVEAYLDDKRSQQLKDTTLTRKQSSKSKCLPGATLPGFICWRSLIFATCGSGVVVGLTGRWRWRKSGSEFGASTIFANRAAGFRTTGEKTVTDQSGSNADRLFFQERIRQDYW
jgi:hypothetical protein